MSPYCQPILFYMRPKTMFKITKYITFLFPIIFIASINTGFANPMSAEKPEQNTDVNKVELSDIQKYALILAKINTSQASMITLNKYINVTSAIVQSMDPTASITAFTQLSKSLLEKFNTLNQQETVVMQKLAELTDKNQFIVQQATNQFVNLMQMSTNIYDSAHNTGSDTVINGWVLTLIDTASSCPDTIPDYFGE